MKYPKLGSISHGTLRPEDLVPVFLDTLDTVSRNYGDIDQLCEAQRLYGAIDYATGFDAYYEEDEPHSDLARLDRHLNIFAPPYCYFGAHSGDGSDFGFWLQEDWKQLAQDDGVPIVSGWEEIPANHHGLLFLVNDHGNVTLYGLDGKGDAKEVFAIV